MALSSSLCVSALISRSDSCMGKAFTLALASVGEVEAVLILLLSVSVTSSAPNRSVIRKKKH